jgi:outer membrane lipoprotein-sorting protein
MSRLPVLGLLLSSLLAVGSAQPSGEEILKKIEANYAGIQDYSVALDVAVDLERLKVPKMKATMYFKQPDKVHFVSEGFALLPKEGVGFTPKSLSSRFDVESVKEEKERSQYVLTLKLRSDRTRLRKTFVLVDSKNWTVASITTPHFDGRQMKAAFDYQRVAGYWLPASLNVTFSSDTTETEPDPFGQMPGAVRSSQIPRKGSISVRYSDYKINTGLTDEVFESKVNN